MIQIPNTPVVEADLGDGVMRRFFLRYDELVQIKTECGRGFYSLYINFLEDAEPHEVITILRLALIGGGEEPKVAKQLTDYYCKPPLPLKDCYILAYACLEACWKGPVKRIAETTNNYSPEEMDSYFSDLEAAMLRNGQDPSWMKGKSFAQIQEVLGAANRKNPKSGPAPDADIFNAIKRMHQNGRR